MYDNTLAAIDIGTNSIKILVAEKREDFLHFEVLGFVKVPSSGLVKGAIVDADEVSKSIKNGLEELKKIYSEEISSVYVNIGGRSLFSTHSDGTIMVSMANKKILEKDIQRVLDASLPFSIKNEKEVLGIFPKEYTIDDEYSYNPLNMRGKKLRAKTLILTTPYPDLEKLKRSVSQSGLIVSKTVPSFLADAAAVLTEKQKEGGVVLINIGTDNINLSIFKNNKLLYFAVLPFGSANVTNDIVVKLNCKIQTAERIKKEIGKLLEVEKTEKKKIELVQGENEWEENLIFSPREIYSNVILPRIQEMLEQVNLKIGEVIKKELLPAGAVITGGGAKMLDIVDTAKKKLNLNVEIGTPKLFNLINEDPGVATVCGMVLIRYKDKNFENQKFTIKTIEGNVKKSFKTLVEKVKNLKH